MESLIELISNEITFIHVRSKRQNFNRDICIFCPSLKKEGHCGTAGYASIEYA